MDLTENLNLVGYAEGERIGVTKQGDKNVCCKRNRRKRR